MANFGQSSMLVLNNTSILNLNTNPVHIQTTLFYL